MALGTAAILLPLETTKFIAGVRCPLYESAYNRTVKGDSRRKVLLAMPMCIPVSNLVQWRQLSIIRKTSRILNNFINVIGHIA